MIPINSDLYKKTRGRLLLGQHNLLKETTSIKRLPLRSEQVQQLEAVLLPERVSPRNKAMEHNENQVHREFPMRKIKKCE